MTTDLILPKFNMDMEGAVLLRWLRSEGDLVQKGDPVAEVETDKVNMEVEATADGILFDLRYAEGDTVPVTASIARIAPDEAAVREAGRSATEPARAVDPATPEVPAATPSTPSEPTSGPALADGRVRATPAARRLARANGIDIAASLPTGGRVTAAQVQAHIDARAPQPSSPTTVASAPVPPAAAPVPPAPPPVLLPAREDSPAPDPGPVATAQPRGTHERIPLDATRRAIAQRMMQANEAPQITLFVEVRCGSLSRLLGEATPRPSFSAIFAVAVARALGGHPDLNCTFEDGAIISHPSVHLGIAVARPNGLIVPVLRDADRLTVGEADRRIREIVGRARYGRLHLDEVSGGTFTITSLGEAGVDAFAPLLNPPQVGILGIGRMAPRVVAVGDGMRVEPTMQLSVTCDHRVIDGAPAAAFLGTLRGLLERPDWLAGSMAATRSLL